jgi:S-adenosylmethionine decarboxylase
MGKTINFGEHLTIDGYGGNFEKLNSKKIVKQCLKELPDLLGMKRLARPKVYFAKGNNGKDPGGWTGFMVIEESHISIHTFPGRCFISIDVYTCRNGMDTDFIKKYFTEKFELKDLEVNFIKRGTRYPECNIA